MSKATKAKKNATAKADAKKTEAEAKVLVKEQPKAQEPDKTKELIAEIEREARAKDALLANFEFSSLTPFEQSATAILTHCACSEDYSEQIGKYRIIRVPHVLKLLRDMGAETAGEGKGYMTHDGVRRIFHFGYNVSCASRNYAKQDFFVRVGKKLQDDKGYLVARQVILDKKEYLPATKQELLEAITKVMTPAKKE